MRELWSIIYVRTDWMKSSLVLIFPFYRNCYLYLYLPYCGPFCLSDGESFRYGKGLDNEKRRSVVSLMGLVMDLGLRRNDQGFSGRVWSAFSVSFLAGILVIYAEQ